MKTEWKLTREAFDKLLEWLSPDREKAGRKYEEIRCRLIRLFNCRGCSNPEELADDTINRVIKIIESEAAEYSCAPILLFFGVAKKVFQEWTRRKRFKREDLPIPEPNGHDPELDCLDECMDHLPVRERSVIRRYYEEKGREKIRRRETIAAELGIDVGALRVQACRIRKVLRRCIVNCLETKAA